MTVPSEEFVLAADFANASREQWSELVAGVLRKSGALKDDSDIPTPSKAGARPLRPTPPEQLLASTTYDGITLAPLYTAADTTDPVGVPGVAPFIRGGRPEGAVRGGWDVRQRHIHPEPAAVKDAVLADLEHGVTSLWLTLGDAGMPVSGLPEALSEVYLDLAPVVLDAGAQTAQAAEAFFALVAERGTKADEISGNLGADPLGLLARTGIEPDLGPATELAVRTAAEFPKLRAITVDALPYHDAGGSDAEELGCSLAVGVAYLRALTAAGLTVDAAFGQLEFRYAATADQFLSIAKLRAARRLWSRVGEVCGVTEAARAQRQHAVTSSAMMTGRDPWVNLLRTTLACFAAGVGGADSVTVQPFDARLGLPDDFARRIARNTQALLVEESHVARVIDPAGGSWYVERLTAELATTAWAWFTELERAGGFAAAFASGLVGDRLAKTWSARAAAIARRKDAITGVSEFPNLTEKLPVRQPAPEVKAGGLPRIRYAQDFEALRDRSDRHTAATGTRPTVFLATLGPVAAHTARASFAANLFQAGGLETPTSGAGTDPDQIAAAFTASGAAVACLCGSDRSYGELAAPVASALKAAGARRIWLAGKAGERAESDSAAGIDGYVFTGCDALDVLTTTLHELGVA